IERPGDDMQQASVRNGHDEPEHQDRVEPPTRQVRRARAGFGPPGECSGYQQPDWRTARAQTGRVLPGHAQSFNQVTSGANSQKRTEHIPVGGTVPNAGRTPRSPPKEKSAAAQKKQPKN